MNWWIRIVLYFFYREAHSHDRDERAKPHKTNQNKYSTREVKKKILL